MGTCVDFVIKHTHVYSSFVHLWTWLTGSSSQNPLLRVILGDSGLELAEREVCRRGGKKNYISSLYSLKSAVVSYNDKDKKEGAGSLLS